VQVAQRWLLARLRNEIFFPIEVLNERIGDLLEERSDPVAVVTRWGRGGGD
jgi:hypothetical protein